jgi:hypothetical protein
MSRTPTPACQSDLACYRNDGHAGPHAYATSSGHSHVGEWCAKCVEHGIAATPAPLDVTGDDFRDLHERAMRDHILACNPEHCCDDLCSDEIITRLVAFNGEK